jgi:hypothetical protein
MIQATRVYMRGTLDYVPTRTRPARPEASTPEILRLVRPRVELVDPPPPFYLLTDKAFKAPLPSTRIQHHRHGCSATGVGAAPASNHAFLLPIPEWAVKKAATIHTTSDTVLPSTLSQLTTRYTPRPGFLGVGLIRSSTTPAAMTRPDLDHRQSTKE